MDYYRNFLEVNDNFNCSLSVVVNWIVIVICEFKVVDLKYFLGMLILK